MFFWNSLAFLMIQRMLAIWSLFPLPFLKPPWTSGSSWFMFCWSLAWRILSIILLMCEMSAIVQCLSILWHCLSLGLEWKLTFPVVWPLLSFQICWHIECSTFTASSFRIWNSSTGIPSPPLALFVVILPKANLTWCSRMSGSRWMITQSWLSKNLYCPWKTNIHLTFLNHFWQAIKNRNQWFRDSKHWLRVRDHL